MAAAVRRYDLDWLRVIAFGLLIFYHIGMFYVSWPFHVKSAYAGPTSEPFMLIVNPWRLALLFFISGVAVRFASDKAVSAGAFLRSRAFRLGLPILAGIFLVVAPQTYLELRQKGVIDPGYAAFYADYVDLDQKFDVITPTWNHLWYVVYLLTYIALLTPFLGPMRRFAEGAGGRFIARLAAQPWALLLLLPIPFVAYAFVLGPLFPTTHALLDDWHNHAHRLSIFLLGYLVAKNDGFWRGVAATWKIAAGAALAIGAAQFLMRIAAPNVHDAWAAVRAPFIAVNVLYAWATILALLGVAQDRLNAPSPALRYLTGAVFFYYIAHQTITIVAGYHLTQLSLGPWPEFFLVSIITIVGCAAGYEIVKRIPVVRIFFGARAPLSPIAARAPQPA